MINVIGVHFPSGNRVYYFDPGDYEYEDVKGVIVETSRGVEFGELVQMPHEVEDNLVIQPLKPIIRIATEEDLKKRSQYAEKEKEAYAFCQKKIESRQLDMKLVSVEFSFDGSKVVFYFTADERVDFRELVKDLASEYKTRIELRQIGVRDETKLLGGLGPCGRPVCCKAFLDDFRPVSIKMAKEQNLSLSPTKISGLCGRLMCCLQYEEAVYEETKKKMPKVGKEIQTPNGIGTVTENNAVTERTRVKLIQEDGSIEFHEYHYSELCAPGEKAIVTEKKEEHPAEKKEIRKGVSVGDYVPPVLTEENKQDTEKVEHKRNRRRRGNRGGKHNGQGKGSVEQSNQAPAVTSNDGADKTEKPKKKRNRNFFRRKKKPADSGSEKKEN